MQQQDSHQPNQSSLQGFLLTGDWEDVKGRYYLRFFGISHSGPFEVIMTNQRPGFYVEKAANASLPPGCQRVDTNLRSFEKKPLDYLSFVSGAQARQVQSALVKQGIRTYESDLKPAEKFLMDREIFAEVVLKNPTHIRQRPGLVQWIDPEVVPLDEAAEMPAFSSLSFDIETGKQGQLFSIGMHFLNRDQKTERTAAFICKDMAPIPNFDGIDIQVFSEEGPMLEAFLALVAQWDPDLLIGWNVVGFDLDFMLKKMKGYGLEPRLGRNQSNLRIFRAGMGASAVTHGRVVVDVPRALRLNFFQFERYGLDYVAKDVLGEGKLISSQVGKWDEIERQYYHEPEALIRYNVQDAVLVTKIVAKTGILNLLKKRSIISGMLLPRVGGSTAAFDHQMLPAIHKAGFVAPDLADIHYQQSAKGGHVFYPEPGLHEYVVVLDFRSLYPSIIKTFHMDPLAILMRDEDPVDTPVGIKFSRQHHALPGIISRLLDERAKAKATQDGHLSQAIKILMNSFYGVMGSSGCRFYHQDLPDAITGVGRFFLEKSKTYLEDEGYRVIYGDTDSVFVCLKPHQGSQYQQAGEAIAGQLNQYFKDFIKREYGLDSFLDMEYEKCYRQFFLPPSRGESRSLGGGGASEVKGSKKRYAGMMITAEEGDDQLVFTGMEYVRSDWTKLAKTFQWQLYQKLFLQRPFEDWLKDYVKDLHKGRHDEWLVYRKRLTKPPRDYTKSKPPHVKAALRLLEVHPGADQRYISYVMTEDGPVPVELEPEVFDYEHYVEKQLKPIADTILPYFGASFDSIVAGAATQPLLFD